MNQESIHISSGTIVRTILILLGFYLAYILRDILLVVLTAVTITAAIEPANRFFIRRKFPRALSVIIVFLILGMVVFGLLYFFLPSFISDTLSLLNTLPKYVDNADLWNPLKDSSLNSVFPAFSIRGMISSFAAILSDVTGGIFTTVSGIFGGVISFVLIIVLSFYLSVQEDGVGNFLRIIVPDKHEKYILDLWRRSEIKIGLWLQGQLLLGVIIGLLTFLGLSVIGMKSALLLAVLAAVLELIPIFGIILALVPALAIAITDGGVTLGILVLGLYIIVQQFEAHLIYPLVVRKIVGIPPILVILTLLVGLKLAGFIGVILSVPVAAVIVEILNDIEKKKFAKQS